MNIEYYGLKFIKQINKNMAVKVNKLITPVTGYLRVDKGRLTYHTQFRGICILLGCVLIVTAKTKHV